MELPTGRECFCIGRAPARDASPAGGSVRGRCFKFLPLTYTRPGRFRRASAKDTGRVRIRDFHSRTRPVAVASERLNRPASGRT